MINRIKEILTKDIVQRIIYGFGLLLWTWILWDTISGKFRYSISSLGISYMKLYLLPALILGFQIVRNNKILWGLVFGLFTTYIVFALYMVLDDAIERSGNHVKAIDWKMSDIFLLLVIFTILGCIDWVIFQIRPKRMV